MKTQLAHGPFTYDEVMKNKMDYAKSLDNPTRPPEQPQIGDCEICGAAIGKNDYFPWHNEDEDCRSIRQPRPPEQRSPKIVKIITREDFISGIRQNPEGAADNLIRALAQRDELLAALNRIAFEPQGEATASHAEVLRACEQIAKSALAKYEASRE